MSAQSEIEIVPRVVSMIWEPPSGRSTSGFRMTNWHDIQLSLATDGTTTRGSKRCRSRSLTA
jgi:hypothetical protein